VLRVGFIGAGRVNFGWSGDPWDHASRLEVISETTPIEVVGIFDLSTDLCTRVLNERRTQSRDPAKKKIWLNTKIYSSLDELISQARPQAVWIGVPPAAHGSIEAKCVDAGIHMLVEKPIHCGAPEVVEGIRDKLKSNNKVIVSVGYMLRYCKAVDYMKNFLTENKLQPTMILARYNTAYSSIGSKMWWDIRSSGGPIIEQATHFCDLMRYFGGEIDMNSISAISIMATEPLGKLNQIPKGVEDGVPDQYRITRGVHATFKYQTGAIGVLSHGALMQGTKYHTQFEIWCDGYRILLSDPYSHNCSLEINDKCIKFPDDDMYLTEDQIFIKAILSRDPKDIRSSYSDAVNTYLLTWNITQHAFKKQPKL